MIVPEGVIIRIKIMKRFYNKEEEEWTRFINPIGDWKHYKLKIFTAVVPTINDKLIMCLLNY